MNRYTPSKLAAFGTLLLLLTALAVQAAGAPEGRVNPNDYTPPKLITCVRPEPVYYGPGWKISGFVTLEINVGSSGSVEGVKVLYRTSDLAVKSSIRAVEQWHFTPATFQGKPIAVAVAYSLPFGENLPIFANSTYPDRILNAESIHNLATK